ncbi:hypothetical protein COLO4_28701 [Corchorus olitorius]|uniref:Uncharacterized protein n=1 Tax=Corchorus olitorius TaxID=93759 RepID=A0A1R3HIT4_9ROSI|nr:hypothetical protein COLO4_28701 [Corchorus olitorius]
MGQAFTIVQQAPIAPNRTRDCQIVEKFGGIAASP